MKRFFLLFSLLSITLFGCQVTINGPVQVSDITFDNSEITLTEEQQKSIKVRASDNRSLNSISWSTIPSNQDNIRLTPEANHATIKGLKQGSVKIKATEEGTGKVAVLNIKVNKKPSNPPIVKPTLSIKTLNNETSLIPGTSTPIEVRSSDNKEIGDLTFTYGTNGIVEVTKVGNQYLLKALKNGTTSITATESKTDRSATIDNFTVTDAYINVVDKDGINVSELNFIQKESKTLNYEIKSSLLAKTIQSINFEITPEYSEYFSIATDSSKNTITITQNETNKTFIPTFKLKFNVKLSDSYTAYSQEITLNGTPYVPPTYSDIVFIDNYKTTLDVDEETYLSVKATNDRELKQITWSTVPASSDLVTLTVEQSNGRVKVIAKKEGTVSIKASESVTGKTVTSKQITINKKIDNPNVDEGYSKNNSIGINAATNDTFDGKKLVIGRPYNVIGLNEYGYPGPVYDLELLNLNIIDYFTIEEKSSQFNQHYYQITPKDIAAVGATIRFIGTFSGEKIISPEYVIAASDAKPIPPTPKPEEGGGSKPDSGETPNPNPSEKPTHQPNYKEVIAPTITPNPKLGIKEIIPNPRHYANGNSNKEKVYWLGGIEPPTQFKEYTPDGTMEYERDPFGKPIEGTGVVSNMVVPNYYVVDGNKNRTSDKPTWYNVVKSYSDEAPDSAMCWAMASAGALHWWFDYLGKDYTDKLLYIRENRTDVSNPKAFKDFNGGDIHYNPLDHEGDTPEIQKRSGIGAYAIKSFYNQGGDPRDLFRLYFLDNPVLPYKFNPNKKPNKNSLGLLHGMGYIFGSGANNNNDELLWENIPLSNIPRNDIVNAFKKAINEQAAVVLSQGNMGDNLYENADTPAHAIIVWGVIFDESGENLLGLYIGDNNLKEGNLARIDLVYKQLSNQGGRYYYAAPYMNMDSSSYLRQTSIYAINLLYPPTQNIKNWIDTKAAELNYPEKKQ